MNFEQVYAELAALDHQLATHRPDKPAFREASAQIDRILLRHMTIHDLALVARHLGRPVTVADEAHLVVTAAAGRPLSEAFPMPASLSAALVIQHGRRAKGLSQAELAAAVDMTQPQIARIETLSTGVTLDTLQRILTVLGESLTIA